MSLNREELARFLAERLGENFDEAELDDETIARFTLQNNEDEEEQDEEQDEDESTPEDGDSEDSEGLEGLENIDTSQLSPTELMLYNTIMSERKRARKNEINTLISTSGLSARFIPSLKRLMNSGADIKEIRASIEDFKEIEKSSTRGFGADKFIPKNKLKTSTTSTKTKSPQKGYELGKMLAEMKNKGKKIGGKK